VKNALVRAGESCKFGAWRCFFSRSSFQRLASCSPLGAGGSSSGYFAKKVYINSASGAFSGFSFSLFLIIGALLRNTGNISRGDYNNLAHVGYVDTATGSDKFPNSLFNVERDAIKADGSPANLNLALVRFVKVQTAIFVYGGTYGDVSTEIVSGTGLADQSGGGPDAVGLNK
jgi:hypothetical protein